MPLASGSWLGPYGPLPLDGGWRPLGGTSPRFDLRKSNTPKLRYGGFAPRLLGALLKANLIRIDSSRPPLEAYFFDSFEDLELPKLKISTVSRIWNLRSSEFRQFRRFGAPEAQNFDSFENLEAPKLKI